MIPTPDGQPSRLLRPLLILQELKIPLTMEDLALRTGIPYSTLVRYIPVMERYGFVQVVSTERTRRGKAKKIYIRMYKVVPTLVD